MTFIQLKAAIAMLHVALLFFSAAMMLMTVGLVTFALYRLGINNDGVTLAISFAICLAFFKGFLRYLAPPRTMKDRERAAEVYSDKPLKGWKLAYITLADQPFWPLFSRTAYSAIDEAVCPVGGSGPPPHEFTRKHACGFFAHIDRHAAEVVNFNLTEAALLEVELYGEVSEGSNDIYRAQFQRVLCVWFDSRCQLCRSFRNNQAAGLIISDRHKFLPPAFVPVCEMHAEGERLYALEDVRQMVRTDVRWRQAHHIKLREVMRMR